MVPGLAQVQSESIDMYLHTYSDGLMSIRYTDI